MISELGAFLLVAEHGTFTEAARRAHLSQPALTASVRRLEESLGARVFDRGRMGAKLTAAGVALLPHARATLAALDDARRAVAEISGLERGEVRIGAGATACTYLLPPYFARFRKLHPGVVLRVREVKPAEILEGVDSGALDLGVVSARRGERWWRDELVLVGPPDASLDPSAPATAFVTFPEGTNTRQLLERHFPEAEIAMELASIASVKGNVRAGAGVSLVSRAAVEHDLAIGRLCVIDDPRTPITRELRLVHRGAKVLSPSAAALRDILMSGRRAPRCAPRGRPRG